MVCTKFCRVVQSSPPKFRPLIIPHATNTDCTSIVIARPFGHSTPCVWQNDWSTGKWAKDSTKCTKKAVSTSDEEETMLPVAEVKAGTRAPSRCSKCHVIGHRKNSKACPLRNLDSISQSEGEMQEQCIVVKP